MRRSRQQMKRMGTRLTLLAAILALVLGVINLILEFSVPHANLIDQEFVFFTVMSISFVLISVLFFVVHRIFLKM